MVRSVEKFPNGGKVGTRCHARTARCLKRTCGALVEARVEFGDAHMSARLEIHAVPLPAARWKAVEKLSELMASDGELAEIRQPRPLATPQIP